jgi:hypothetical protein
VTKLLAVRLITKDLKIIFCLFVGYEENQAQELSMDAARGRHARRQKSYKPVAVICVAIIADLVGSGALEDVVRVVGVAELALSLPIVTCAFEIVANGDVYQQIVLPRHADVADFEIGACNTWSCAQVQLEAWWRQELMWSQAPSPPMKYN